MKPTTLSLSLLTLAASVLPVSAQTATKTTAKPAARTATAAHKTTATTPAATAAPACVSLPHVSEKVPALPADANCVKPLFSVSVRPNISLDYASPLMTPETLDAFIPKPTVITLLYVDTKVGTGELAKMGKFYTVKYTGYLPDGTKFDSSLDHEPGTFTFPRGAHKVIAGWDLGFDGMRVGGKRRLYIPFQLGYGEQGQPPSIPGKSELIFDMELISQSDTPPAPPTPPAAAPAPKPSPAGAAAPPPTTSTTPAATEPAKPAAK